jgi:hypothetical protein
LLIECAQNIISTRFRPNHRHALLIWIWLIWNKNKGCLRMKKTTTGLLRTF